VAGSLEVYSTSQDLEDRIKLMFLPLSTTVHMPVEGCWWCLVSAGALLLVESGAS
jgi:hypothetical protein